MMDLHDARVDAENLDLENMDIGSCRLKIIELLRESDRRNEALAQIQNRIQVCNNELAARREQVEEIKKNTLRRLARIEFLVRVHTRALGRCALQK